MTLTDLQREALDALGSYENPVSARQVADRLERPGYRKAYWAYDATRSVLEALSKKGAARREMRGRRVLYAITDEGKAELE